MPEANSAITALSSYIRPDVKAAQESYRESKEVLESGGAPDENLSRSLGQFSAENFDNIMELLMAGFKHSNALISGQQEDPTKMLSMVFQMISAVGMNNIVEQSQKQTDVLQLNNSLEASKLIDNFVRFKGQNFTYDPDYKSEMSYTLPGQVKQAIVEIYDSDNRLAYQKIIKPENGRKFLLKGENFFTWDGELDPNYRKEKQIEIHGQPDPGRYRIKVTVFDQNNKVINDEKTNFPLKIETTATGRITSSELSKRKRPFVVMNDLKIPLESLVSIHKADQGIKSDVHNFSGEKKSDD